jgi:transcriptional regulator with XRE-family HTH domain
MVALVQKPPSGSGNLTSRVSRAISHLPDYLHTTLACYIGGAGANAQVAASGKRGMTLNDERAANAVDRRVGQRVRMRRLEIGMSQERLAEILGITFQQIQKYEKGINRIAASRLWDISAALDMSIARFFEGLSSSAKSPAASGKKSGALAGSIDQVLATPEGMELIGLFATIKSRRVRQRVVDLVRTLTEAA